MSTTFAAVSSPPHETSVRTACPDYRSETAKAQAKVLAIKAALEEHLYEIACAEFPPGTPVRWFTRKAKDGTPCFSRGRIVRCDRKGFIIVMPNLNRVKKRPSILEHDSQAGQELKI